MKSKQKRKLKEFHKLKKLPFVGLDYKASFLTKKPLDDSTKRVKFLRKIFDKKTFDLREESVVIIFGSDYLPIGTFQVSKGSKYEVSSDLHFIFQMLYLYGAHGFLIAHNHPMEDERPSQGDLHFTHTLKIQSEYLGFDFIDHIVLSKKKYFSFRDNGLIYEQ